MSCGLYVIEQVSFWRQPLPAGTDGGVCPERIEFSVGLRHLAQRTGVPMLFGGPNGTQKGAAFAALREGEASG